MEVSEITVEGALEPIHSTKHELGTEPSAGGVVQISTDLRRIASMIRELVVAVVATTAKFSKLARVIDFVLVALLKNRNL